MEPSWRITWKWSLEGKHTHRGNELYTGKVVGDIPGPLSNRKHFYWWLLAAAKWPEKTKTNEAIDFKYDPLKAQPGPFSIAIYYIHEYDLCGGGGGGAAGLRGGWRGGNGRPPAPLSLSDTSCQQIKQASTLPSVLPFSPYRRRLTHFPSLPVPLPGENSVVVCVYVAVLGGWVCVWTKASHLRSLHRNQGVSSVRKMSFLIRWHLAADCPSNGESWTSLTFRLLSATIDVNWVPSYPAH